VRDGVCVGAAVFAGGVFAAEGTLNKVEGTLFTVSAALQTVKGDAVSVSANSRKISLALAYRNAAPVPILGILQHAEGDETMIAKDFLPTNDEKFAAWLNNYITVATGNQQQLGLTDADMLADNQHLANVLQTINTAKTAAAASKAASKAKATNRTTAAAAVRAQSKRIQLQPNVPDNLLLELGLPVRQKPGTPGTVAPVRPATVSANPHASGTNTIKWKNNGNKPGTIYVVQALTPAPGTKMTLADVHLPAAANAWNYVTSISSTRFLHDGCTPGQTMYYRIIAQRGTKASVPSDTVVVYGP